MPGADGAKGATGATGANGANGSNADGGPATCVPNVQIACKCAGGSSGVQTCAADGLSYGVCACLDGGGANDAGDGGDGGDGGAFSIATLPGLVAWFKGDTGIVDDLTHAGHVKRWLDQSGNGNDAEQAGGTTVGPTHDPSAVNGIDAVSFDGQTGLYIAAAQSLKFAMNDFGFVFVAKIQPGTYGTNVLTNNTLTIDIGPAPGSLAINASGATASLGWPPGTAKWRTAAVRGKTLKIAIDDSVAITSTTTTADLSADGSALTLFPNTNGTFVELAELLIINGALSDGDLAKVQSALKTKYGL